MTHIRQQIRDRVQAELKTALSTNSVFVNRTHILREPELPSVIISTNRELAEHVTLNGLTDREVEVTIAVHARAADDVDDTLDNLCVLIENALEYLRTEVGGFIEYNTTDIAILDGDQQIAVATMTYTFKVFSIQAPNQDVGFSVSNIESLIDGSASNISISGGAGDAVVEIDTVIDGEVTNIGSSGSTNIII